jgi:16S rRNA (adenine1518-N6/adenine1519-N6)-dimethyltransferase
LSALTASDIRSLTERLKLRPSKALGQNFVVDPGTVRRIVSAAQLDNCQPVIEIGPGLGSLTLALLETGCHVTAIEIDPLLAKALPETVAAHLPEFAANLRLIQADALLLDRLDMDDRVSGGDQVSGGDRVSATPAPSTALVANLPYSVATKVLLRFLERFGFITKALVMVQREVAERLVAAPGSRLYGVPSVKLAWWGVSRLAGQIPRNAFFPVPRVESSLVLFERRDPIGPAGLQRQVFTLVDAAFAARRKTLRAALAPLVGSPARAELALKNAQIDPSVRGETLNVAQFARLANSLEEIDG